MKPLATGFESDQQWLLSQIKALKELCRFPHISLLQTLSIAERIKYYEKHLSRLKRLKMRIVKTTVKKVHKFDVAGRFVCTYPSVMQAAEDLKVHPHSVYAAIKRKGTCRKFYFSYSNTRNISLTKHAA